MNFSKKINYFKPKVTVVSLFLLFSLTILPIHTPKAHALWGEFPAQIYKTIEEQLTGMMGGMIRGGLKTAAIKAINSELGNIVGGSSSQVAKFITDYQDFLIDQPKEKANIAMNDYLSQAISQGRGSVSGYASADSASLLGANYEGFGKGSFGYGLAMNNPNYGKFSYFAQANSDFGTHSSTTADTFGLEEMAKAQTTERKDPTITYHGEDIADASNNFENLQLFLSGINNQWKFDIHIQKKYSNLLEAEKTKAITKAESGSGFAEDGDKVTTPGIITKDAVSNALNIGNQMLATASDPGEILTAVVQSMITKAIQNGIGQAGAIAQRTIQSTTGKVTSQLNTQASTSGVGALFNSNSSSSWTNPDTGQTSTSGGGSSSSWTNPDTGSTYDSGSTASTWTNPDTGSSVDSRDTLNDGGSY